jgi:hypothetical protein
MYKTILNRLQKRSFASAAQSKANPPPAEGSHTFSSHTGFMAGLNESKILCHTKEQTLANPELASLGKDGISPM